MSIEELLNKLIEKGWKPFGDNAIKFDYDWMKTRYWYWAITYKYKDSYIDDYWDEVEYEEWKHQFNNRELVSKESWLWQFVCEHWMIKTYMNIEHESRRHSDKKHTPVWAFDNQSYYYLIESALKDESELEEFLLSNIKVGWQ